MKEKEQLRNSDTELSFSSPYKLETMNSGIFILQKKDKCKVIRKKDTSSKFIRGRNNKFYALEDIEELQLKKGDVLQLC